MKFGKHTKIFLSTVLGAALLLSVSGCNKAEVKKTEFTVTVGITQEPNLFDPHTAQAAGDKEILFNVFEGFYKFKNDGTLEPALATDCEISSDCREYVFTVRKGVKFHNGEDMKMSDVIYSVNRAKEKMSKLSSIESVEQVGDDKVKIVLSAPDSDFLSFATFAIIPESVEDINKTPVGTGPFTFSNYVIGDKVSLKKNSDYWQEGLPKLGGVDFKICADMDSGLLELQNGSIDIFPHMTADKAALAGDQFETLTLPSNMVQIFALNNKVEPLNDPKVREAINYGVNKEELIKLTMDGNGLELTTAMSPVMGEAYDTSLDGTYKQDIEKAKALLKDAGYENGFDLEIAVPGNYLVHVNTAVAIADQLKAIGIKASIKEVDWNTWLSDVYNGRNYEATVICLTSEYTPYDVISRYDSEADGNFINYSNPKADEIIRKIPSTLDNTERMSLYHELLGILTSDNASCYIQDPMEITVVRKSINGYKMYPMYVIDMKEVDVAER